MVLNIKSMLRSKSHDMYRITKDFLFLNYSFVYGSTTYFKYILDNDFFIQHLLYIFVKKYYYENILVFGKSVAG